MIAPFLDRESFEQDEAFTVENLGTDGSQQDGELWQGEVVLTNNELPHQYHGVGYANLRNASQGRLVGEKLVRSST